MFDFPRFSASNAVLVPRQFSGHHAAFFVPCSSFSVSFLLSRTLTPSLFPLVFLFSPLSPPCLSKPSFRSASLAIRPIRFGEQETNRCLAFFRRSSRCSSRYICKDRVFFFFHISLFPTTVTNFQPQTQLVRGRLFIAFALPSRNGTVASLFQDFTDRWNR